jgi:hypothetical protein
MCEKMKIRVQWTATIVLMFICFVSLAWAGNRAMVEQRTKELDEENKQAVGQISDLPKDGIVDIKAKANYKEGKIQFDIYDTKISEAEEKKIRLDNGRHSDTGSVKEGTVYIHNKNDTKDGEKQENDPENN